MSYVWRLLRWLLAALLTLLLLSCLLRGDGFSAVLLGTALATVVAPAKRWTVRGQRWGYQLLRGALVCVALSGFVGLLRISPPISIYASEEVRSALLQIYDEKMKAWPVAYEERYIETSYGRVHVIVSGTAGNPPLLLLHASGVGGWSWKYNAKGLSEDYRIYAIDLIGDAGKSTYRSLEHVVDSKEAQADLYAEIADALGVTSAYVVGASEGGFIASNFARYHPERVRRLALIAPMGYAGATGAIMRIMLTQLFPLKSLQEGTFAWSFSQNQELQHDFGTWFNLVMSRTTPVKLAPLPFSAEERQQLTPPVLFIFGERDNLVGDPERARALVQDIPDVTVMVVDAGHLAAAESPARVNALLHNFFAR